MLEQLKKAESDQDEYQRRAIKARKDAADGLRAEIGLACDIFVHVGKLYGSVGMISCKRGRYESIDTLPPSESDLAAMLEHFRPVEMSYRKGACTSFRPAEYSAKDDRETDVRKDVAPITIKLKPGQWQEATAEWYGRTSDGEVWRVQLELPYQIAQKEFGTLRMVWEGPEVARYLTACDFTPRAPFDRVKWGTGEFRPTHPNEFTLYAPIGTDVEAHILTILQTEAKQERESTYRTPTPAECLQSFAEYLKISPDVARYVRQSVIKIAEQGGWKAAKEWFGQWVRTESGTTQTIHPVENSWYQLAGSLPEFAGEKYHAGNSKRYMGCARPADGGLVRD